MELKKDKPLYIFGAKYLGRKLASIFIKLGYDVKSFIDNDTLLQGTFTDGLEVVPLSSVSESSQIVIASVTYVYPIQVQLEKAGYKNFVSYPLLTLIDSNTFPPEPSLDGLRQDILNNQKEYDSLNFCDEESYRVLKTLIEFRKTYDFSLLNNIKSTEEYFESFMPKDTAVFVDGGAFDGDTVEKYIKFVEGKYKKIYLFEPDRISFTKAVNRLKNRQNIDFHNCGLYDKSAALSFCSSGEPGSSICDEDNSKKNCEISCRRLDDIVKEKAFIKLDVEGAEPEALRGAQHLLKTGCPLAVCVYHKPSHLWEIQKLIESINPEYSFYLRHYSDSVFDTILYGVIND